MNKAFDGPALTCPPSALTLPAPSPLPPLQGQRTGGARYVLADLKHIFLLLLFWYRFQFSIPKMAIFTFL